VATSPTTDAVAAARDLAPLAADLAERGERERRLPAALSDAFADAGLYRLCVPAALGGPEASPHVLVDVLEVLGAADAAAAWCVGVCATSGMLAAYLPDDAAREVYGDSASVVGGVFAPMGRAEPHDGSFTIAGRWRFASNAERCTWLMGGCIVLEDGAPRLAAGGRPDVRLMLFPAGDAELLDTWHVAGLKATGSVDMAVDGLRVPAARSASIIAESPRAPGALYAFPPFGLLGLAVAGVALGIARGALDDLVDLAGGKTPTMSTRKLAERPDTQSRLAHAEAEVRAARAGLHEAIARAWEAASAEGSVSLELRVGLRLAASHTTQACAAAVDAAYHLGGGSALYETSPLQRRFRDVHAATQHMVVGPSTWEVTGRALLGLDVDDAQV
jgi:indole-3-acetate monooxygenase